MTGMLPPYALDPLADQWLPEADTPALDWQSLARHLADHGHRLSLEPKPRRFASGLANLNFRIGFDGAPAVLRRPPPGQLPPGAYDMGREFRILSRLWRAFALAPRGLFYEEDQAVFGAPFQILEYRRGFAVRATLPEPLAHDPAVAARLGRVLIEVLAQLHAVDPDTVGLGDLGRPEGFLERSIEGWARRGEKAREQGPGPLLPTLATWLRAHRVPDGAPVLLHNDYKLDNLLLDPDTLDPVAVVDWDQGTRGDALFDLATLLSYWTEPGDPPAMHALSQMPSAAPGFPSRREAAARYADLTGRDLSDFKFHRVLGLFKLGVVFHQLHARYRQGQADARYLDFGAVADGLLEFAEAVARDEYF
jgi:aminoglycoside phosphotransferase (APT) family kinase protein